MARKDLFVCDVCEKSEAVASGEPYPAERRGMMRHIPPLMPGGWGHIRLHCLPKVPEVEKTEIPLDFALRPRTGLNDEMLATFRAKMPTRIMDIDVTEVRSLDAGWLITEARVGNIALGPHARKPQTLSEFAERFRNRERNGFIIQPPVVQPGMEFRMVLVPEKSSSGAMAALPRVTLKVEQLRPAEKAKRESGDAIICADCLDKLSIRIGEREVNLVGDHYLIGGVGPGYIEPDMMDDLGMGDVMVGDDIAGDVVRQFPVRPFPKR